MSFRVHEFIPKPIRCYKCQRYGHVATSCRSTLRCSRCGESHEYDECQAQDLKCCLCGGDHSAAYKGCPKFVESKQIQEIKVREKMSCSQAVLKVQSQSIMSITTQNSEVISPESQFTPIDHNQPRRIDPEPISIFRTREAIRFNQSKYHFLNSSVNCSHS